jgi:hypothetical protein
VVASMSGHSVEMLLGAYYHPRAHGEAAREAVERLAEAWNAVPEPQDASVRAIR